MARDHDRDAEADGTHAACSWIGSTIGLADRQKSPKRA